MSPKRKSKASQQSDRKSSQNDKKGKDVEMKIEDKPVHREEKEKPKTETRQQKLDKQKMKKVPKPQEDIPMEGVEEQKERKPVHKRPEEEHKKDQKDKNKKMKRKGSSLSGCGSIQHTFDLESKIVKEEQQQNAKKRVKFPGIKEENQDNQICHICYQYAKYPDDEQSEQSPNGDQEKSDKDARLLYQLIYCQDCFVPVHWNCYGEHHQIIEFKKGTETYFLFQCDKCSYKQSKKVTTAKCIACDKENGFLKICKRVHHSETDLHEFIHPTCAILFPEQYYIVRANTMDIKYFAEHENTEHSQLSKKKISQENSCCMCGSSFGRLLKCNDESCKQHIHAYCMMDYLKGYIFEAAFSSVNDLDQKYNKRWRFQIFTEDVTLHPKIEVSCNNHLNTRFCSCGGVDQSMIMCDFCFIWYHAACEDGDISVLGDNPTYLCKKCVLWKEHLNTTILDVILRRKDFASLVEPDLTSWTFGSILIPNDRAMKVESKIFEQILYFKLWQELQQLLIKNTCHVLLISSHIQESEKVIFNCDSLKKQLLMRKIKSEELILLKQQDVELRNTQLKDIIDEDFNFVAENEKHNRKYAEDSYSKIKPVIDEAKLITEDTAAILRLKKQNGLMKQIYNEVSQSEKILVERVFELIEEMQTLDLSEMRMYQQLQKIYNDHIAWQEMIEKKMKKCIPSKVKTDEYLLDCKKKMAGDTLVNTRFEYLMDLYGKKLSQEDLDHIIEEGRKLKTRIDDDIFPLKANLEQSQEWEKLAYKIEKKWKKCALWNTEANSFIRDFLNEEEEKESQMEVDSGKQTTDQFIWSLESAQRLVKEAESSESSKIYKDQALLKKVKEKVKRINDLKKKFQEELSEQHDAKKLKEYMRSMQEIQNVDFKIEIQHIQKKLDKLAEIQRALESDATNRISLERLESLTNEIGSLSNAQEHPIQLPWDMTMMLQTKVQVARDLKHEFHDIVQRNSDTFTKQMISDLKRIVQQSKDHHIEMKEEQNIVTHLQFSEDWFFQTFEKLKNVAGKGLHQVDFKDFLQLQTVVSSEKDCDQLLKCAKPENLVGAAKNLHHSLSGVKQFFEIKKLLSGEKRELAKISTLDQKSKELNLEVEQHADKDEQYGQLFEEFNEMTKAVSKYQDMMGTQGKIIKTLKEHKGDLKQLKEEISVLSEVLSKFRVVAQGVELEQISKIHSYIEFTLQYQDQINENKKITHEQAMLLQAQAKESHVPNDIPILKELNESVARFEKFRHNYQDYQKFRERMKKQGANISQSLIDSRFTCQFLKKLIDQAQNLDIEIKSDYFDKEALESDLQVYDQWRVQADVVIGQLEENEININSKELRQRFETLKLKMKSLPVYDRETFTKISLFDWLFKCVKMLEQNDQKDYQSLGTWEGVLKQGEEQYAQQFSSIRNHSIYQRLVWEIDQAKTVMDFVNLQKNNQKSLAAKYSQGISQNYAIFKGKHSKKKLEEMLGQARFCKIDVLEEIRSLESWIKNYDNIQELASEGQLYEKYSYDKLKEFSKQMYLSPIDYGDTYFDLKNKLDTAESIKQDIKRINQEYDAQVTVAKIKEKGRIKRMRYSRLAHDVKQYHKECKIKGIKEIDQTLDKVNKCRESLKAAQQCLEEIQGQESQEELQQQLDKARQAYQEVEYDMESEETEVRRSLFEYDLKLLFNSENKRKLQLEEFKELEKEFESLKNHLKDEQLHAKFLETKTEINELVRRINKVESKEDLHQIENEIETQYPFVDFTQLLTDKDVEFQLGKRKVRSDKNDDNQMDLAIDSKRLKLEKSEGESSQSSKQSSSSNGESSDESGSSSSGENDSSSSGQSSSNGNESSSSEDEDEESKLNIAQNRSRRNIVPKYQEDFIYESSVIPKGSQKQALPLTDEQKKEERQKEKIKLKEAKKKKKREKKRREKEREKRAQRDREAQVAKKMQKQQMFKGSYVQECQSLASQLTLDQGLQESLQAMKTKIREQSRMRIKENLEIRDSVFSQLEKDQLREIIIELETESFNKHPDVDHFYRKKIGDICENIKFLKDYREVAEQIAIKKSISILKMSQPHPAFKDSVLKVSSKLKEKRANLRQQQFKEDQKVPSQGSKNLDEAEVEIPQEQQLMSAFYPSTNTSQNVTPQHKMPIVKTLEEESDDLESIGGGDAHFSDGDYNPKSSQSIPGNEYDPYQPIQSNFYGGGLQITGVTDYSGMYVPPRIVQYNPYEAIERYTRYGQKKSQEPILYDPNKNKLRQQKEKNMAPPGSLLKVWDGNIELAKHNNINCQFYSTYDISVFQTLPDIPQQISLKGKAKTQDVVSHFLRLRKDKKVIRGWVVRKNPSLQDNNDKYTKLYEELEEQQKSVLFNVFQGVTLYLVPIGDNTKEFCKQMGIQVQQLHAQSSEDFCDVEMLDQEEKKCFAFICQIKQQFQIKGNFWNPDVLRMKEVTEEEQKKTQKDYSCSPITSDDEENKDQQQHQPQIAQSVKNEGQQEIAKIIKVQQPDVIMSKQEQLLDQRQGSQQPGQQQHLGQQQYQSMEEEDDIDIDDLIFRFKSKEIDLQSIQAQLLPIINKVKGAKEQKLTAFLTELIQKYKNPEQPVIKQEQSQQPMMSMPQTAGYNQPQVSSVNYPGYGQQQQQPPYGQQQQQRFPPQGQIPQQQQQQQPQQQQQFLGPSYMYSQQQQSPSQQPNQSYQMPLRPPPSGQIGGMPHQLYGQQPPSHMYPQQQQQYQPRQQQQFQGQPPRGNFPPQGQSQPGLPPLRPPPVAGMQQQQRRPPIQGQQQQYGSYGQQQQYYPPPQNK